jgi:uncharacterized protein (DUF2252 family)
MTGSTARPRRTQPGAKSDADSGFFDLFLGGGSADLLAAMSAPRPPREARMAAGKALRKHVPRSAHAQWAPAAGRAPLAIIAGQNATRVQALVPLRMERMSASPFAFLRGSAAVMAADLQSTPVTGITVVACGDMHIANCGLFASAERQLVFAINDFDEVYPGPWEWDVKRLAASAAVAALHIGGTRRHAAQAAFAAAESYVRHMHRYAEMGFLETWYDLIDEDRILDAAPPRLHPDIRAATSRARSRGHLRSLGKLTEDTPAGVRLAEDPPILIRETTLSDGTPVSEAFESVFQSYVRSLNFDRARILSRYRLVDVTRKVVGVGSVGTSCWVMLLQGADENDPLFLQVKEARESVLAAHVNTAIPVSNQGRRVVAGQRMIQGSPDIFLGYGAVVGHRLSGDFYVRQLADMKGGFSFDEGQRDWAEKLPRQAALCGWALALAHAKSGDAAMIAGYCGSSDAFPDAIQQFALAYMDQTFADHDQLVAALAGDLMPG